jgi:type I restriction enzyme S subunit
MSSEWPSVKLEEVTSVLGDGLHGTPQYDDEGGYYFINGSNLIDGRIEINDRTKRVSAYEYEKHKKNLNSKTILVSINGTLGNVSLYSGEKVVLGKSACYFNVKDGVDKHFVRYVVGGKVFQDYLSSLATGSTIKNVSLRLMRDFSFKLPPYPVQLSIAGILKSLDDRITLLRETNQTLEAIAQAIFKSWFVDFDPVRAKMEGRQPVGMDEETAALFPDELVDSELGVIPKGWEMQTLSNLAHFQNGYAFKSSDWAPSGHPVVKIGNVKPSLIDFDGCSFVSEESTSRLDRFRLCRGDLLVGMTGYVGEVGLIREISPPAYLNQRVGKISTQAGITDLGYVFCVTRNPAFKVFAESNAQGSAQANVSGTTLMGYCITMPTQSILNKFNDLMTPILESVIVNAEKIDVLCGLRDTLLPRLISGKLRVPVDETDAVMNEE